MNTQNIIDGINAVKNIEDKHREQLKNELINGLDGMGAYGASLRVKNEGLPSKFVVSSDIYDAANPILSRFAEVYQNPLIQEKCQIFLLWDNEL